MTKFLVLWFKPCGLVCGPLLLLWWGWLVSATWRQRRLTLVLGLAYMVALLPLVLGLSLMASGVVIAGAAALEGGSGQVSLPYAGNVSPPPRLVANGLHGEGYWPGRDWATPCGTPLYAPLTGRVIARGVDSYVGPYGRNNSFLTLSDGLNAVTLMHGAYTVDVGAAVVRGRTLIGHEASIGNSSECHTHMAWRVDGKLVNPISLRR